jgi:quinol-cytochrome oxidoreductase complex cytochrome b subunit
MKSSAYIIADRAYIVTGWLLRSAFICFLLQALTGALLTLHYEPSLRPAMTESGKPIIMLETTKALRHKPTQTRYNPHELLFAEYDTAAKAPFYAPDTLRFLTRILAYSQSNTPILPNAAYYSVEQGIMRSADFGALVRGVHAAAANLAVIILTLWLGISLLAGTYSQMPYYHWAAGIVLFTLTLGTSVLGYILPMNLRSLAALNILLATLESTPLVGKWLAGILRGASSLSSPTLVRVYALHVLFIPAVLAGLWYALRTTLIWRGQTITNTEATNNKEWAQNVLLGIGIVWVSVMMACCIATPSNLALMNLPADFTAVIAAPQQSQPEWYALGMAALLRVLPAWGMMTGLGVWISLATALPFVTRLSASLAMIVRGTCSVALLGLCVLTLWELQWYTFPTVILTEENLELVIVISILSGLLGGVLTARLRQES